MINIFSAFIGTLLFSELIILMSLLKPLREPYFFRDWWLRLQKSSTSPARVFMGIILSLFFTSFLEITYEKLYYRSLLNDVDNQNLVYQFYISKISTGYICFSMAIYLLILIERIIEFLTVVARLLEFELMCRHAILMKEQTLNQLSSYTVAIKPSTDINSWLNLEKTDKRLSRVIKE